ncbi:MAG: ABC transporter ATP-binding protein [Betaproteobacteria bacterium]|nr:ABC transporter ATP-binding protein [Betaproteobacteria bacterium]
MGLLEVRSLSVAYGKVRAVLEVSLSVSAGEIVSLVGANGAGKSTLMKALMSIVPIQGGEIDFDGKRLNGMATHRIANLGIGYVSEGRATLKHLTVGENLRLGAYARPQGRALDRDTERVLARFPVLNDRLNQVAGTLSGGEQQMLVIGRALMMQPRLLLLDEPSLGLAPLISLEIFRSLATLASEGVGVLLVEQNAKAALTLASRGYVMESGRLVLEGANLANDERVKKAYLGEL